jgi:phosphatidylinositol glycan class W
LTQEPKVFSDFVSNTTVTLRNGKNVRVLQGSVTQINNLHDDSVSLATEFSIVPRILPREDVNSLLQIIQSYPHLDDDPDTVDGMPTYEIFVDSPDLYRQPSSNKVRDNDPKFVPQRRELRARLQAVLQSHLQQVVTPFVQEHVSACRDKRGDRVCTPCYSLIRRYRHSDRLSHGTHHDGHAIATVVVSLSEYGIDYRGGLYVSTGYGQEREFLGLHKGDAVVHQSTLLHGVQVHDIPNAPETTERWSWILWFRDSADCHDYGHEWFADCATQGNALCQQLHSTKVGNIPGISPQQAADAILELNRQAAEGGAGMAAVKVARAYLHQLPSTLPLDVGKAKHYFDLAMRSHNPDGNYGMAMLLLQEAKDEQSQSSRNKDYNTDPRVVQAVQHLEAAAMLHHSYAQYNLGMAHTYGYGTNVIDGNVAAEWFIQCGLPEGYFVAAQQAMAVGDQERYRMLGERAQALGFFAPWRTQAREATGSGGAAGVSLNLPWPIAGDGREPFHLPSQIPPLQHNNVKKPTEMPNMAESDTLSAPTDTPETKTSALPPSTSMKALKEAAVTGHDGSSHPWEVLWVCTSAVTGCAMYNTAVTIVQQVFYPTQNVPTTWRVMLEASLLWFPMVLAQSEFLYPYATCVIALQLVVTTISVLLFRQAKVDSHDQQQSQQRQAPASNRLDFLTLYRSSILYLTFIAILAVDFPALFPRRFCKTEISGYGLMDIGAASFCISAGLVGARRHVTQMPLTKISVSSWKPFLHTMPLVLIGVIRIIVNKELDYQEHVSEYGVHWNFFFTLGILTLVPAILGVGCTTKVPSIFGPLCVMIMYQALLSHLQWQQFVEAAPRTIQQLQPWVTEAKLIEQNPLGVFALTLLEYLPPLLVSFFVANREGMLGCCGYLCLYYAGEWVGYHWLWRHSNSTVANLPLGQLAVCLWLFHLAMVHILKIPVSRRSTNLGFCSWALAHNVILLYGLQKVESWIKPQQQRTSNAKGEAKSLPTVVPPIWEKVNKHGLIMFLIANLLTGLVNLTVPTLETESWLALVAIFGYISCIGIAAIGIDAIVSFMSTKPSKYEGRNNSQLSKKCQ